MRPSDLFKLSPLAAAEPNGRAQLLIAAAPWALVAVLALALLAR